MAENVSLLIGIGIINLRMEIGLWASCKRNSHPVEEGPCKKIC